SSESLPAIAAAGGSFKRLPQPESCCLDPSNTFLQRQDTDPQAVQMLLAQFVSRAARFEEGRVGFQQGAGVLTGSRPSVVPEQELSLAASMDMMAEEQRVKRTLTEEAKKRKGESERARSRRTRVNLGLTFSGW
ncbi:hypothetical protein GBF38_018344, partial [Nibea albiflora]